jgi:glutamate carboxypeptidase
VDPFLKLAKQKQKAQIAFLKEMVELETPSGDQAAIGKFNRLLKSRLKGLAVVKEVPGQHLVIDFQLGGRSNGQILALAHSDTVWAKGTLPNMPFKQFKGRLWGPGVLDIKGGIAQFVTAMQMLLELGVPVGKNVVLQVNADEEIGSPHSRSLTETMAHTSDAVLVLEPGSGLEGKLKTARKGIADFQLQVTGIAAHAGVDFSKGASAIVEAAHQIQSIAKFTNLKQGVTVNPGVIQGGTRDNVIAANTTIDIDVRVPTKEQYIALEKKFASLKPKDARCQLHVSGQMNRPPMVRTSAIGQLFKLAQELGGEIGLDLQESSTGGGSDGNFTAALGIPTLDGLGCVGEGAHAPHESVLIDQLAPRTALLAKLVAALGEA